jgi:hypothetical protein
VDEQNSSVVRVAYVRNIRRVAAAVAAAVVLSAGLFVYRFGLGSHPHRVSLACVIAGAYLLVFGSAYSFVYRSQMAAAKRM